MNSKLKGLFVWTYERGERPPWWVGLAWVDWAADQDWYAVLPVAMLARWLQSLWRWMRGVKWAGSRAQQMARLEAENAELRKRNQRLFRLLTETPPPYKPARADVIQQTAKCAHCPANYGGLPLRDLPQSLPANHRVGVSSAIGPSASHSAKNVTPPEAM